MARFLLHRRTLQIYVVAAVAIIVVSALSFGFFMDDYLHILGIEGKSPFATAYDLFRFAGANPAKTHDCMELGPMPWCALPDLKLHFLRPLSSATMVLDHALFGRWAPGYHLHSLLWYAALLAAAGLLFRRTLPGALGLLALLMYAVDAGHAFPVIWWSNRNALVAVVPALLGLWAHLRWREDGWKPGLALSLLGYAIGLCGGETALGVFGYLGAYELLGGRGLLRSRIRALIPAALLGAAYLVGYTRIGGGAYGSGIYIDPIHQPLGYLLRLPGRLLLLMAAHFFGIPAELPILVPATWLPLLALSGVLMLALLMGLRAAWPALSGDEQRSARWWLVGAILSALPVLSTFPSSRLLLLPSLGWMVVVAVVLHTGWRHAARPLRVLAWWMAILNIVIAPLTWPLQSRFICDTGNRAFKAILAAEIDPEAAPRQHVVIVSAQDPLVGFYPMICRLYYGQPMPRSMRALSLAPYTHRLHRTAADAFELEVVDGAMLTTDFEKLMRDNAAYPMRVGDTVRLTGMEVTVLAVGAQGPTRIGCRFDAPLEDPGYCFLSWRDQGLRRLVLPPVGGTVDLPREPAFISGVFDHIGPIRR
jgi:hypothetical protein